MSDYKPAVWPHPKPTLTRTTYHRMNDLSRLNRIVRDHRLPLLVSDVEVAGDREYQVRPLDDGAILLARGRFQLIATYLQGWTDAREHAARQSEPAPVDLSPVAP